MEKKKESATGTSSKNGLSKAVKPETKASQTEVKPKKAKRVVEEPNFTLKQGDIRFLSKVFNSYTKSSCDYFHELYTSLYDRLFLNTMLICDLFEALGYNPISHSETLRFHLQFYHSGMRSSLPGHRAEGGRLYDADGNDVTDEDGFNAREKGVELANAINVYMNKLLEHGDEEKEEA